MKQLGSCWWRRKNCDDGIFNELNATLSWGDMMMMEESAVNGRIFCWTSSWFRQGIVIDWLKLMNFTHKLSEMPFNSLSSDKIMNAQSSEFFYSTHTQLSLNSWSEAMLAQEIYSFVTFGLIVGLGCFSSYFLHRINVNPVPVSDEVRKFIPKFNKKKFFLW